MVIAKKPTKTFTLVEVMIVAFILVIAVLSLLRVYISALDLAARTKEVNIATDDLKDILEKVDSVPFAGLTTDFPDNCCLGPGCTGTTCPGGVGIASGEFLLDNEKIEVSYPDGGGINPLTIKVEATWTGRGGRAGSEVFKTIRTKE